MDSKKKIVVNFGNKVRELRNEKELSQAELASIANLHRTYVGMIERAEKNITLINIEKIANALEINIKELF
jgi:transcriptional regulator with XRE-family HTH domain